MENYYALLNEFFDYFKGEYGNRKLLKIDNKIYNSTKVDKLIEISKARQVIPNHNDYLPMLHEIPYFIFAKRDTIACGCFLALERWNKEVNEKYILADENQLIFIFNNIKNSLRDL